MAKPELHGVAVEYLRDSDIASQIVQGFREHDLPKKVVSDVAPKGKGVKTPYLEQGQQR